MTIGQKIVQMRNRVGISQEQLAEILSVSRQSVSKWEIDSALPHIDKLLLLCDYFKISTDDLLRDKVEIRFPDSAASANKYFGTDGFRGEANVGLTSEQAYKVGRFLGWYYASPLSGCSKKDYRPKIVIGKDTRRSSYMLEYAIAAGLTASGADAYMLHVTTTASVSYITRLDEFDCGIMITASHNPFYDNGIKVINRYGEKLDDNVTAHIEAYLDGNLAALGVENADLPLAVKDKIGCMVDYVSGRNRYVGYLISLASHAYRKMKIGLDCANGAAWNIAPSVFGALGAQLFVIGDQPNGLNVNEDCGSTSIERLCQLVKENHLDVGFAFDGDADRCFAVDENGNVADGDKILYVLANRLKSREMLNENTVAATIMSNSGLQKSLNRIGIRCEQTAVGDRYVYECMQNHDYSLGGEQSGHIIIKKYATTGDGILTAIMLLEEMCDTKQPLSKLCDGVTLYPQYTVNLRVKDKAQVVSDPDVLESVKAVEALIDGNGRVVLRSSGTEPLVRIMVEAVSEADCRTFAETVASAIRERGFCYE